MNDRHQNEIEEEYGSNTEVTNQVSKYWSPNNVFRKQDLLREEYSSNDTNFYLQVQRVNLLTWDVELMHPMLMRRLRVQSTVLNGFIYVLSDDTDQVER